MGKPESFVVRYRGEEVVSYIQRIPDTDWFMEAKINTDEIFSEAQTRVAISFTVFAFCGHGSSRYHLIIESTKK